MLTVRPTKMLAKRLGIAVPDTPPSVTGRLGDWCVHDFRVSRHRFLMFCNTAAMYPMIAPARGVTDGCSLVARLVETLSISLRADCSPGQWDRLAAEAGEAQWAPIPGRSILGGVNEMVWHARWHMLESEREYTLPQLSRRLAEMPLATLGGTSPDRAWPTLRN